MNYFRQSISKLFVVAGTFDSRSTSSTHRSHQRHLSAIAGILLEQSELLRNRLGQGRLWKTRQVLSDPEEGAAADGAVPLLSGELEEN